MYFQVLDDITDDSPAAESGTYIKGLFLEGARWDYEKKCLGEALPRRLYDHMPPVSKKIMVFNLDK